MDFSIIGKNLKKLRLNKNKTQQQVADELGGYGKQMISKYETGEVLPPIDRLIDLANYYNVTLDEIVNVKFFLDKDMNELSLDYDCFVENYKRSDDLVNVSNFKYDRDIYFKDMDTDFFITDKDQTSFYTELSKKPGNYNLQNMQAMFGIYYDKNLYNSLSVQTNSVLDIKEQIGIIYSLGGRLDLLKNPTSLCLDISNSFLLLCKLASVSKLEEGRLSIVLNVNELITNEFHDFLNVDITEMGRSKIIKRINEIISDSYSIEYLPYEFEYPLDNNQFLAYLNKHSGNYPKTYEELLDDFKLNGRNELINIERVFKQKLAKRLTNEIIGSKFNVILNNDEDDNNSNNYMNGMNQQFANSAKKCNVTSVANYLLIEQYFEQQNYEEIWKQEFFDYSRCLGLDYSNQDIVMKSFTKSYRTFYRKSDELMNHLRDYIKTTWFDENYNLLDMKTVNILKGIIHKVIVNRKVNG